VGSIFRRFAALPTLPPAPGLRIDPDDRVDPEDGAPAAEIRAGRGDETIDGVGMEAVLIGCLG